MNYSKILTGGSPDPKPESQGDSGDIGFDTDEVSYEGLLLIRARAANLGMDEDTINHVYPLGTPPVAVKV